MREIKFRGWSYAYNEWIYGRSWTESEFSDWEYIDDKRIVITGSVGQLVPGVRDADGREIYEGDILETRDGERLTVRWCKTQFRLIKSNGRQSTWEWVGCHRVVSNEWEEKNFLEETE